MIDTTNRVWVFQITNNYMTVSRPRGSHPSNVKHRWLAIGPYMIRPVRPRPKLPVAAAWLMQPQWCESCEWRWQNALYKKVFCIVIMPPTTAWKEYPVTTQIWPSSVTVATVYLGQERRSWGWKGLDPWKYVGGVSVCFDPPLKMSLLSFKTVVG